MSPTQRLFPDVRWMALACGAGAVGLGVAWMSAAGAPTWYLVVNAGALLAGVALAGLYQAVFGGRSWGGAGPLVLGSLLLATTVWGVSVAGATRWVTVAGFSLQPSLILIPLMLVAFARGRGVWSTLGIVLACAAVALQPDRGMAGALLCGILALALLERDRWVLLALAASVGSFVATLLQVDAQGAMPFVDRIFYTSFDVHPLAGVAVLGGAALLLAPSVAGVSGQVGSHPVRIVFGATWLGVIVAAAVGNFPTPLVGYGGSAILGYVLSAWALPTTAAAHPAAQRKGARGGVEQRPVDPGDQPRFRGWTGGVASVQG